VRRAGRQAGRVRAGPAAALPRSPTPTQSARRNRGEVLRWAVPRPGHPCRRFCCRVAPADSGRLAMTAATVPSGALPGALQAQVLHGVLPYLQSIHGKTFVVVCEGAVLKELPLRVGLGRDVALLHLVGLRLVLLNAGAQESLSALSHLHEDLV